MGALWKAGEMFRRVPFNAFEVDVIPRAIFLFPVPPQALHMTLREFWSDSENSLG
jgi:hypothetical protein